MKIAAIEVNGEKVYGKVDANTLYRFQLSGAYVKDLSVLITDAERLTVDIDGYSLDDYPVQAPIGPLKKNIFCVGKNYIEHSHEFARSGFDSSDKLDLPEHPIVFTKASTSVTAHGQQIAASQDPTGSVDYEGELGVIIGRSCKKVSSKDALDYVYGYTIINDITSRELQRRHAQWFIGKNLDGFCPVGPWIVTQDEMGILDDRRITTHVNGEQRQSAQFKDMIFDVPSIIETLSSYMTLEPGDVIATGTPVGVGIGFNPPRYLQPGDTVTVSIDGIGELTNTMI